MALTPLSTLPADFVLVCFDGLSAEVWAELRSFIPAIAGSAIPTHTNWAVDAHGPWAELLTGKRCPESKIFGFAHPANSLENLVLSAETDIVNAGLFAHSGGPELFVNVPLVRPRADRVFLSDGSPGVRTHANTAAAEIGNYRARAYSSIATARAGIVAAVEDLADVEIAKLRAANALVKGGCFRIACIRTSFFDQIAHLLGADWVFMKRHRAWHSVQKFLAALNSEIALLIEHAHRYALFSLFSHVKCTAAVNVNIALERGGFYKRKYGLSMAERKAVVARLRAGGEQLVTHEKLMFEFELANTRAASVSAGCVYINSQGRYSGGIVSPEERASLSGSIANYLKRHLQVPELKITTLDNDDPSVPDLLLHAPGVDFSSYSESALDTVNKPASVHDGSGFAIIPTYNGDKLQVDELNAIFTRVMQREPVH